MKKVFSATIVILVIAIFVTLLCCLLYLDSVTEIRTITVSEKTIIQTENVSFKVWGKDGQIYDVKRGRGFNLLKTGSTCSVRICSYIPQNIITQVIGCTNKTNKQGVTK